MVDIQLQHFRLLRAVLAAPCNGFQPCDELEVADRLDHVIVRALAQRAHHVFLAAARAGEQDGQGRLATAADASEHLHATDVPQVPVENQYVEAVLAQGMDHCCPPIEMMTLMPAPAQPVSEQLRLGRVVFDYGHTHGGYAGSARSAHRSGEVSSFQCVQVG